MQENQQHNILKRKTSSYHRAVENSMLELHSLLFFSVADLTCGSLSDGSFGLIVEDGIRCQWCLFMPPHMLHELSMYCRWTFVCLRNKVFLLCASSVGQRGVTEVETLTQTMSVASLGNKLKAVLTIKAP